MKLPRVFIAAVASIASSDHRRGEASEPPLIYRLALPANLRRPQAAPGPRPRIISKQRAAANSLVVAPERTRPAWHPPARAADLQAEPIRRRDSRGWVKATTIKSTVFLEDRTDPSSM